jgi:prepilin-type N-terminal cleavage/methylation domain-containing protein
MNKKNRKLNYFVFMLNTSNCDNRKGFTLIEIMVSVAIFTIIMTTGIGALVSITNSYRVSQEKKQVNDALNFSLESMTRELRLGQNYYVPNTGVANSIQNAPQDGDNDSIGFEATGGRGYFIFRHNKNNSSLVRETIGGESDNNVSEMTNPDLVEIIKVSFKVIGTDSSASDDIRQPLVWIRIQAKPTGASNDNISTIQTLVSQRLLDI